MADEVVVDWPHRLLERVGDRLGPADAVCVLTHDHKFDVPAIVAALATDVGYLGAMGSRRTHAERVERLREEGVTDDAARPGAWPPSDSTSAPAPPRRPPSRSAPRSSPTAPATPPAPSKATDGPIH